MTASPVSPLPLERLRRLAGTATMRAMDDHAIKQLGIAGRELMENAATAVADTVAGLLAGRQRKQGAGPVVVCCGAGNNGGDGYAVARLLTGRGHPVTVIGLGEPTGDDARANAGAWRALGTVLDWKTVRDEAAAALADAAVVVDALFGTGLGRPIAGEAAVLIETINEAGERGAPVVAVDIPSGIDGDTGQVMGAAVRASHTVSFQAGKPGCHQHPGAGHAGQVTVAPIGIPESWPPDDTPTYLTTPAFAAALLPRRPAAGHKGTFGHLLAVCGSAGMGGAAMLAGLAGLKTGAGLVTLAVPGKLQDRFVRDAPELMTLAPPGGEAQGHFLAGDAAFLAGEASTRDAVVAGCGLGRAESTGAMMRQFAAAVAAPMLIDADGLHALTPQVLRERPAPTVITPHPGELARLSGISREELGAHRLDHARRLAMDWGVVLVLKGAGTVVASPGGQAFINPTGDQALASAGTGDVLSGIIGGLLAQGLAALPAAVLGVFLHGLARDCQREALAAPYFSASDLIAGINLAFQELAGD